VKASDRSLRAPAWEAPQSFVTKDDDVGFRVLELRFRVEALEFLRSQGSGVRGWGFG